MKNKGLSHVPKEAVWDPQENRWELGEKHAQGKTSLSGRYIESIEHYFVLDAQVRLLLKLDRNEEAYTIVARVLSEDPDFKDFRDVRESPGYLQWISQHRQ